jgi:hypothetical protein
MDKSEIKPIVNKIPRVNAQSPTRLIRKAFYAAKLAAIRVYQKLISK